MVECLRQKKNSASCGWNWVKWRLWGERNEIDEKTRKVPAELMEYPEIKRAVTALEESAFTPAQLQGYEKFWDAISVERTLYSSGERKGWEKGWEKGREEEKKSLVKGFKAAGIPSDVIACVTGLSLEEIEQL